MQSFIPPVLVDRLQNILNSASTLAERLHANYDQLRSRRIFSGLYPSHPFYPMEQDLQELHATIQALKIALANIESAMPQADDL
jgi:hypothetical protein